MDRMRVLIGTIADGIFTVNGLPLKVYYDYDTGVFSVWFNNPPFVDEISILKFHQLYKNYPSIISEFNIIQKKFKRDNLLSSILSKDLKL